MENPGASTPRNKRGRLSMPPDDRRCLARSKQRQDRCQNYREPGLTVCRIHGAKSPSGFEAKGFQTGRYSRALPRHLTERFETLVADPEILDLSRDLALLDARAEELIARLESGESSQAWQAARDALTRLDAALREDDERELELSMRQLVGILSAAAGREATWRDIRELLQERRLLAETERRRLVDLHQMVTVEELMLFASALVGIVNRYVDDQSTRTAIAVETRALLSNRGPAPRTVASYARAVPAPAGTNGRHPDGA